MALERIVQSVTGKITENWFAQKEAEFERYNSKMEEGVKLFIAKSEALKKIDNETDYKGNHEVALIDELFKNFGTEVYREFRSLEYFCWDSAGNIFSIPNDIEGLESNSRDAKIFFQELCDLVRPILPEGDVKVSFNLVDKSISLVESALTEISNASTNDNFHKVCSYLRIKVRSYIWNHFSIIRDRYLYGMATNIRLEFDLNKQQLAALVYLITESKMLDKNQENLTGKYDFFETYFYWTDQATDSKHPLGEVRKLLSTFRQGERYNSVDEVMKYINEAYNK